MRPYSKGSARHETKDIAYYKSYGTPGTLTSFAGCLHRVVLELKPGRIPYLVYTQVRHFLSG